MRLYIQNRLAEVLIDIKLGHCCCYLLFLRVHGPFVRLETTFTFVKISLLSIVQLWDCSLSTLNCQCCNLYTTNLVTLGELLVPLLRQEALERGLCLER